MTREEIKIEIQKSLERVPDGVLADILEILKQAAKLPAGREELAHHLSEILREDKTSFRQRTRN